MTTNVSPEEASIEEKWQEVKRKFSNTTKKSLTAPLNLEEALKEFERKVDLDLQDEGNSRKKKDLKSVAIDVMNIIQLLGGLAAQGASTIFGPATMCFNALQVVLTIPEKIANFHKQLTWLLGKILNSVKQFKIYRRIERIKDLGIDFRRSVHMLMIAFVGICETCWTLCDSSTQKKVKIFSKLILLNDDSGLQDALVRFENLATQHSAILDAITLEHVVEAQCEASDNAKLIQQMLRESAEASNEMLRSIGRSLDRLIDKAERREAKDDKLERLKKIAAKLDIVGERKASPLLHLDSSLLEESGSWLRDLDDYKQWIRMEPVEASSRCRQLLLLSGEQGTGKSYLLATVIREIDGLCRKSQKNPKRISTASHVFDNNEKASQPVSSGTAGQVPRANNVASSRFGYSFQALKMTAMQFAESDELYAQRLSQVLEDQDVMWEDSGIKGTISHLFSLTTMPSSNSSFYVLILDGLQKLQTEEAKRLFKALLEVDTPQLRVAISGTPDVIDACFSLYSSISMSLSRVDVASHNKPDIKKYIKHSTEIDSIFGAGPAQSIADEVRNQLPDNVCGNFNLANAIINNVREALRSDWGPSYISKLIHEDPLKSMISVCEKTINELQNTLSPREVEQLNELLTWTLHGRLSLQKPHLKAIMFLLMRKEMYQDIVEKIKEKFFRLLKVDTDGTLVIKDDAMKIFFGQTPRLKQVNETISDTEEARMSMHITITNAKATQVRQILWKLSEKVILDQKDSFVSAAPATGLESRKMISANPVDGNLHILHKCFDLLSERVVEQTRILSYYATRFVLHHIPAFQPDEKEAMLSDSEKQTIVDQLIAWLQDPDCMETCLTEQFFAERHLLEQNLFPNIREWLSDTTATANVGPKPQEWIKSTLSEKPATILKNIAQMVARHWLCETQWLPQLPYMWLTDYLDCIKFMMPLSNGPGGNSSDEDGECRKDSNSNSGTGTSSARTEQTKQSILKGSAGSASNGHINSMHDQTNEAVDADTRTNATVRDVTEAVKPVYDPVSRAVTWVKQNTNLHREDSSRLERLGLTYLAQVDEFKGLYDEGQISSMRSSAKDALLSARKMGNTSWQIGRGLAKLHVINGDFEEAVVAMGDALGQLKLITGRTKFEQDGLIDGVLESARWQIRLKHPEDAVRRYKELVGLTPGTYHGRYELFELYCSLKRHTEAIDLIEQLKDQTGQDGNKTVLYTLLLHLCGDENALDRFESIFRVMSDDGKLEVILETLGKVPEINNDSQLDNEVQAHIITLKLAYGVALAYYATIDKHRDLALAQFRKCVEAGFNGFKYGSARDRAVQQACSFFMDCTLSPERMSGSTTPPSLDHLSSVKAVLHDACYHHWYGFGLRAMLASFYRLANKQSETREISRLDIQVAFLLLEDDNPGNDFAGYGLLAIALMHTGDDLNALSALSLVGPQERCIRDTTLFSTQTQGSSKTESTDNAKSEPLGDPNDACIYRCDGRCDKGDAWEWSFRPWFCRVCFDIQFCDECILKILDGTLARRVCNPHHDWIKVPSWTSELEATGKGRVRVGGTLPRADGPLQDGTRIGGKIVSIDEFLDNVRKEWGIEKVLPTGGPA